VSPSTGTTQNSLSRLRCAVRTVLCLSCFAAMLASTAMADTFSFTGTFSSDDQVQLFSFTLASSSTVTFQTYGYGGGANAEGSVISPGGFDPYLTWFGPDGSEFGSVDDGCGAASAGIDGCADSFINTVLDAGTYTLALTQSPNTPMGALSDGFAQQGNGNFTATGACPEFCDFGGNPGNGNWALDILFVDSASEPAETPEPFTFVLAGGGLALLALARRVTGSRNSNR
jgi:hypothetical protein